MKTTFEFVEPFDLFHDILGKKVLCQLEILSDTKGRIVLEDAVDIGGTAWTTIVVECRYEGYSLNRDSSGECVNVNGSSEGVHMIGLVCPLEQFIQNT